MVLFSFLSAFGQPTASIYPLLANILKEPNQKMITTPRGKDPTSVLPGHNFVEISPYVIQRNLALYDQDPNVRIVTEIKLNSLLAGDIIFSRGSIVSRKKVDSIVSQLWGDWCRALMRNLWSIGFAAVVLVPNQAANEEHPPPLLDLQQVCVRYRKDMYSNTFYEFYQKYPRNGTFFMETSSTSNSVLGDIIPNVHVIKLDEPNHEGVVKSKMTGLTLDLEFESELMSCAATANRARCQPVIYTEMEKARYEPNAVESAWNRAGPPGIAVGGSSAASSLPGDDEHSNMMRMNHLAEMNRMQLDSTSSMSTAMRIPRLVDLDMGRKLARQVLPESPSDLIQFRMERRQTVFNLFGVPLSMITADTSTGASGAIVAKQAEGINMVFNEDQKRLKLFLIHVMKNLYADRTKRLGLMQYTETLHHNEPVNEHRAREWRKVEVELPGLPDEASLRDMYLLGLLKPDKLIEYLSAKHGVPLSGFFDKPQLGLEQANGFQPKDPEGSNSKSK